MNLRQKIFLAIVVVGNAVAWILPSDVVELVARDKHVLLGRYSRDHFGLLFGLAIISVIGLYIDQAPAAKYKRRWFQLIAVLIFGVPTIALVDFMVRSPDQEHYVRDSVAYHRPPSETFTVSYKDRPEASRTLPNARGGFADVACEYRSDARGYRNRDAGDAFDVVVLGDSFAEGSRVSDGEVWPELVGRQSGVAVYNLGMSGYSPLHYRASLSEHGMGMSAKVVLCMLYEGNDFRLKPGSVEAAGVGKVAEAAEAGGTGRSGETVGSVGDGGEGFSKRLKRYVKQSPIIEGLDGLLIGAFGPIWADRDVAGLDVMSWLPVGLPDGPDAKYYSFAPKQILQNKESAELFRINPPWKVVSGVLAEMKEMCDSAGARLVIVFAPTKVHVVLPLVWDRLPAEKVRDFAALRAEGLPDGEDFMVALLKNISSVETVVGAWSSEHGVPFLSLTGVLQEAAAGGTQVYYTYDQHWTPPGHVVVADAVSEFLSVNGLLEDPKSSVEAVEAGASALAGQD